MEIRKNLIHEPSEGLTCLSPSRTQQQFKEECDVNNIIDNYVNTGLISHLSNKMPVFGDYTNVPSDYAEAVAMMEKARADFMSLPSKVRERFDNDVQGLLYFIQNPDNRKEAEELGLIERKVVEDIKDTFETGSN